MGIVGARHSAYGCASAFGREEAPSAQFSLDYKYGQDFAWVWPMLSPPRWPKRKKADLVTGDPEFRPLHQEVKICWVK